MLRALAIIFGIVLAAVGGVIAYRAYFVDPAAAVVISERGVRELPDTFSSKARTSKPQARHSPTPPPGERTNNHYVEAREWLLGSLALAQSRLLIFSFRFPL